MRSIQLKQLLLSGSFIFLLKTGVCQPATGDNFNRNSIYLELSSESPVYSINYDRIFHKGKKINYSYKIGFSVEPDAVSLPLGVNLITGKKTHHGEISLTIIPYLDHYKTFLNADDQSDKYLFIIPGLGYRYQKPEGKLFFKLVAGPFIFLDPPSNDFWNMNPKVYGSIQSGLGISF